MPPRRTGERGTREDQNKTLTPTTNSGKRKPPLPELWSAAREPEIVPRPEVKRRSIGWKRGWVSLASGVLRSFLILTLGSVLTVLSPYRAESGYILSSFFAPEMFFALLSRSLPNCKMERNEAEIKIL